MTQKCQKKNSFRVFLKNGEYNYKQSKTYIHANSTALVAKKSGLHAQIFSRRIKNRVIRERFKYANFTLLSGSTKKTISSTYLLLVSIICWLRSRLPRKEGTIKKRGREGGAKISVLQKKKKEGAFKKKKDGGKRARAKLWKT